jgi:translation elongation factor EF-G
MELQEFTAFNYFSAGIIAASRAGDARFTDTRADEQERAITMYVRLLYFRSETFLSFSFY